MHLFYTKIIRSFLGDINMGFPYFNIKPSFNSQIADNSAGICIHAELQKSNVFITKVLVVFGVFFHWAWDEIPGDIILSVDVQPHLRQGWSLPTALQQGIKIKDSVSRRNHIYLEETSKSENNVLYSASTLSHLLCQILSVDNWAVSWKTILEIN